MLRLLLVDKEATCMKKACWMARCPDWCSVVFPDIVSDKGKSDFAQRIRGEKGENFIFNIIPWTWSAMPSLS